MIKNGFEYNSKDEDGDYEYVLFLNQPQKTKTEIDDSWQNHVERTKKDLGVAEFNHLKETNGLIAKLVSKIQSGQNEDELIEQFIKKYNL